MGVDGANPSFPRASPHAVLITEARTAAVRAGVVAKPSPLGDERGEFEGGWAMCPDGTNPAFQEDISHGMLIIDLLHKVVLFGISPGCLRAVSGVGSRTPSGDVSGRCLRAFWKHSESTPKAICRKVF